VAADDGRGSRYFRFLEGHVAFLLDTHVLVWAVAAAVRLTARVRRVLKAVIRASVVLYWRITLEKSRLDAPVTHPATWWDRYVTRAAVEVLPVRVVHVDPVDELPEIHRDPPVMRYRKVHDHLVQTSMNRMPIVSLTTSDDRRYGRALETARFAKAHIQTSNSPENAENFVPPITFDRMKPS